jgi:hypothetical protein
MRRPNHRCTDAEGVDVAIGGEMAKAVARFLDIGTGAGCAVKASPETRLGGARRIAQTLIALAFECHEPASHAAQVSPRRASFARTKRNLLKVDEELFCTQLQTGNFVFKFTHRQGSPRRTW